jgi:hypothetical protein
MESDLLWVKIESKDSIKTKYYPLSVESTLYDINETVKVTVLLKNVYGNTGKFSRELMFLYNSHDTLILKIKGNYSGNTIKPKIVFGDNRLGTIVYYYKNDKLIKREQFGSGGKLSREDFFEGSNCIHQKVYHWHLDTLTSESFYKEGKLVDRKFYKIEY